jgi:hypothetical protein
MSLKTLLGKIQGELQKREKVHDEVQRDMRRATRLSKQAILFTHQAKFKEAKKLLKEATDLFDRLHFVAQTYRDMLYSALVDAAYQEYAEAQTLLALVEESCFVSPEKINVRSLYKKEYRRQYPPILHIKMVPGRDIRIVAMPKGGGSENMSRVVMLTPSDGVEGIKRMSFKESRNPGRTLVLQPLWGWESGEPLNRQHSLQRRVCLGPLAVRIRIQS